MVRAGEYKYLCGNCEEVYNRAEFMALDNGSTHNCPCGGNSWWVTADESKLQKYKEIVKQNKIGG